MLTGSERILGEELPALAKEVARVEAVRKYAGKTLSIDFIIIFPLNIVKESYDFGWSWNFKDSNFLIECWYLVIFDKKCEMMLH